VKINIYDTSKKYDIIYADPPWIYCDYKNKKTALKNPNNNSHKGVALKYNLMSIEELKEIPVNKISTDNCVLFLWVTMPKLNECFEVIEAWGFTYKTVAFTWIKKNKNKDSLFMGMGRWTRSNAELCLLATKGNPKRVSASIHSVVITKIEEHSKKPNEVRNRIVELCGNLPRIELFARDQIQEWDCWGNEV